MPVQPKRLSSVVEGVTYGKLTVVGRGPRRGKHLLVKVRCICGNQKSVAGYDLKTGHTRSCGCLRKEISAKSAQRLGLLSRTHGHSINKKATPTYSTWSGMIQRCTNKKHVAWPEYGGRGITVCKKWKRFQEFLDDMGEKPFGLTLERINVNKGYCAKNCRWATWEEQGKNKRNSNVSSSKKTK